MEHLDRQIVSSLVAQGRVSYTDLGRRTGLSTSAAHQRVRRLEERGIVTGYSARVDHAALGLPVTALVSLTPFDPSAPDDVPDLIRDIAEIESCWSVAGDQSYVVLVRVGAPSDLEDLLARIRAAASCATRTTVVLSTPWEGRPVLLGPQGDGEPG